MSIFITGGAGYLGSIIVPRLLKEGYKVTVLDNYMFDQASLTSIDDPNLTIMRDDCRDKAAVLKGMQNADVIFPLACLTGAPLCDQKPEEAEDVIINGLRIILENRNQNQLIIYPTTNSGYGVGEKGKFCTEETPLRPISLYGRLKVQAEREVLDAGNSVTLRLATAFGLSPRMRLDLLVNDFTYKALHDGQLELFEPHFNRNFIHVQDIAKAFMHVLNHFDKMKNEPYNVGLSNANLSKLELCEEIKKQIPEFHFEISEKGKDPDKRDYIVSNEKIEQTGFKPDVSLSDGISELINAYDDIQKQLDANVKMSNV